MFDSHSHIYEPEFADDFSEVLERAKENNVSKIMLVGYNHEANQRCLELASQYPNFLYNSAGLHPEVTDEVDEKDLVILEDFIKNNKVYAMGEIGLDYHYTKENKDKQKWLFIEQIKLAIKYNLPMIIHSRDADNDTFQILKEYSDKVKFVMHCYSGSVELMKEYVKLGAYISLGGPITFKNSVTPKEVCKNVPATRFLVETDSPYMAPVPMRGKRNESSFVKYVLEEAARLKEMDVKELEAITEENTKKLFNIFD